MCIRDRRASARVGAVRAPGWRVVFARERRRAFGHVPRRRALGLRAGRRRVCAARGVSVGG
eukprot:4730481-Lingulodinium_polyedra.AAC.1